MGSGVSTNAEVKAAAGGALENALDVAQRIQTARECGIGGSGLQLNMRSGPCRVRPLNSPK